jgi:hypothetical protein
MRMLLLAILSFVLAAGPLQGGAFGAGPANAGAQPISKTQAYFPGDVVHIIVAAPVDTDGVTAVMPDGQELNLIFDKRKSVWHNYWQVPIGFRKGSYTAKLIAMDVEGNQFEGESSPIFVEEPTLPVILRFAGSEEAKPTPVAAPPTEKPKEAARAVKPAVKPKKKIAVQSKEDFNVARLKYITLAKDYLQKKEYEKAKAQLEALLKIDPDNREVKLMISRIDAIIKARKTNL